ncbi:UNVERIFIED_CONTAM: hypothetical protein Scaly_3040100 [Sesamum calycinum]|uniref:Senescence-associated protein n=1 Tax=Sesamum calycinum TaxID=2727403 RepID=A0AAW2K8I3_9LAMI
MGLHPIHRDFRKVASSSTRPPGGDPAAHQRPTPPNAQTPNAQTPNAQKRASANRDAGAGVPRATSRDASQSIRPVDLVVAALEHPTQHPTPPGRPCRAPNAKAPNALAATQRPRRTPTDRYADARGASEDVQRRLAECPARDLVVAAGRGIQRDKSSYQAKVPHPWNRRGTKAPFNNPAPPPGGPVIGPLTDGGVINLARCQIAIRQLPLRLPKEEFGLLRSGAEAYSYRRTAAVVASSPDSDLEAFSYIQRMGKTNLSHDGLNPAHVPYWWVNNPTLGEFCFTMIGRADIEGSKSNVAMNAWLPQASYPCGNFSDTSSFKFRRCAAPAKLPPDNVFRPDRPARRALGPKRGSAPPPIHGIKHWAEITLREHPQAIAMLVLIKQSIPLVRTSSESTVRRPGKPQGVRPGAGRRRPRLVPTAPGSKAPPSPQSQSFSRVTDPFCRLPLSTLFYQLEAVHLGDLMRVKAVKKKRELFPRPPPTSPLQLRCRPHRVQEFNRFPFRSGAERALSGSPILGSTNPCPTAVHMEPFPTSVLKVLI